MPKEYGTMNKPDLTLIEIVMICGMVAIATHILTVAFYPM
jgi:hypothetical protein